MPVQIDPSQQQNEETTKMKYITPVILERWQDVDKVLMEYNFTEGRISVDEYNMTHRGKPKEPIICFCLGTIFRWQLWKPRVQIIRLMKDILRQLNMPVSWMYHLPIQQMEMI